MKRRILAQIPLHPHTKNFGVGVNPPEIPLNPPLRKGETGGLGKRGILLASCILHLASCICLFAQQKKSAPSQQPATEKAQPPPTPQEGQLPTVEIRAESKTGVVSEKPLLELELNPDEPVLPALEPEEDLLKRPPETLRDPRAGYSASLANTRTILPARIRLAKNPVRIFYPLREILSISPSLSNELGTGWELVITDTEGRAFKKFSGGGIPPGTQIWDGRSNRGEMISAGKTYSTVINYKDIRGQSRNLVGEPFTFDGVVHQESKGLLITLANSAVFETKFAVAETETIGESGLALLQEAADYIKRYYFTYPIKIECFATSAAQATSRAAAVSKLLASLLLLPKAEIPAIGTTSDRASERIVILIANR